MTNPLDSLLLEGVPRGLPKPADNGDGPTACFMRRERARLLWKLAHDDDDSATEPSYRRDLSVPDVTVESMKPAPVVPAMDNGEVA